MAVAVAVAAVALVVVAFVVVVVVVMALFIVVAVVLAVAAAVVVVVMGGRRTVLPLARPLFPWIRVCKYPPTQSPPPSGPSPGPVWSSCGCGGGGLLVFDPFALALVPLLGAER